MEKLFVNRGDYRRLRHAALLPFAQNCCVRVLDNPAYAPVSAPAQNLRLQCDAYNIALHAAENRGRDTVAVKNQSRLALFEALDRLADALEANAAGDPLYLSNAGFGIRQATRRRFAGLPAVPQNLRLRPGQSSGQAVLEFSPVEGARMYAIELRNSPEQDWQNGNYTTGRRVKLQVPARQESQVRVSAIAAGNRRGAWSDAVAAFIP